MTVTAQDINALQGADLPTKALLQRLILDIAAAGTPTAATTTVAGVVKQAAHQAQLTVAPTLTDINTLLTNLQNAGIAASS